MNRVEKRGGRAASSRALPKQKSGGIFAKKKKKADTGVVPRTTTVLRRDRGNKEDAPRKKRNTSTTALGEIKTNSSVKKSGSRFGHLKNRIETFLAGESTPGHADSTLIGLLAVIIIFGLIMLSSAGSVKGYQDYGDPYYLLKHQLVNGVFIGLVAFYIMSHIDYHYWRRYAFPIMVLTLILLFAVFLPGIGQERLGAKRWIDIGGFDFQPSEIVKLTFLMYLAAWLEKYKKHIHDPKFGLGSFMVMLGGLVLLIAIGQKDLGTTLVIAAIAIVTYFVGGAPLKQLAAIGGAGLGGVLVLIAIAPYRIARLTTFLHPDAADKSGVGYHVQQALIAIGSGGLFGVGLNHSQQKFNYLPEVHTDSIFAIVGEELGFLFAIAVIVLFTLFVTRALKIAQGARDDFGRLMAVGIAVWIGFQAVVNIGAMLSLVPLTGIPLPFVSYGSSAMIMQLAAVGILVNISRQSEHSHQKK